MALKSIFGIMERKTLGGFRLPRFFMKEVMSAFCTMYHNVSMNAVVRIPARLPLYLANYH